MTAAYVRQFTLGILLIIYTIVLFRTAWLSDDAYITFRVVDNFISGYGLTWNIAERVQVYTHPLWMLLISGLYFFTRDVYYTSIFFSIALSVATVALLAFGIARSWFPAALSILILTLSKAFTDFSTSGLESPLTHFLLALFLFLYLREGAPTTKRLLSLSLIAGLAALNRMDTTLLYLPVLVYEILRLRRWQGILIVAAGFVPFILWECFAVVYYGFPFPNTAYAKLDTGINTLPLIQQGLNYFLYSFKLDPITLTTIAAGATVCLAERRWTTAAAAAGIALYLLYVIKIGGDFMAGRFFTAALLGTLSLVASSRIVSAARWWSHLVAALVAILLGFASPYPPLLSNGNYRSDLVDVMDMELNIGDERAMYYWCAGLMRTIRTRDNECWGVGQGLALKAERPKLVIHPWIGTYGFYAGSEIHILDSLALADPLLARLPVRTDQRWLIGHFYRVIPPGYPETLLTGENQIHDPGVAKYYDKLALIIRGDLFAPQRLEAIWKMNTGQYNYLLPTPTEVADFSRQIEFVGWDANALMTPGEDNTIALHWRVPGPQHHEYASYVTMTDHFGNVRYEDEGHAALQTSNPLGAIVDDAHVLSIPEDRPAVYWLAVTIYTPILTVADGMRVLELGPIKVPPPAAVVPSSLCPVDARLGDEIQLLGYTAEQRGQTVTLDAVVPGDLTLTLYWKAITRPSDDYHIFVHVSSDTSGQLVSQHDFVPYDGAYPTQVWDAGEIVATTVTLDIPETTGTLSYSLGMYRWPSIERLPVVVNGQPNPDSIISLDETARSRAGCP